MASKKINGPNPKKARHHLPRSSVNAARQRRLALKKRIEGQRKHREQEAQEESKLMGTLLCKHHIPLSRECGACDEVFKPLLEEFGKQPEVMERRLRHGLGLDRLKRAFVFTKMKTAYDTPKIVSVYLSTHHPTQQIMDMRKNGFWAMDFGYLTWFAPDCFTEVCFDNE